MAEATDENKVLLREVKKAKEELKTTKGEIDGLVTELKGFTNFTETAKESVVDTDTVKLDMLTTDKRTTALSSIGLADIDSTIFSNVPLILKNLNTLITENASLFDNLNDYTFDTTIPEITDTSFKGNSTYVDFNTLVDPTFNDRLPTPEEIAKAKAPNATDAEKELVNNLNKEYKANAPLLEKYLNTAEKYIDKYIKNGTIPSESSGIFISSIFTACTSEVSKVTELQISTNLEIAKHNSNAIYNYEKLQLENLELLSEKGNKYQKILGFIKQYSANITSIADTQIKKAEAITSSIDSTAKLANLDSAVSSVALNLKQVGATAKVALYDEYTRGLLSKNSEDIAKAQLLEIKSQANNKFTTYRKELGEVLTTQGLTNSVLQAQTKLYERQTIGFDDNARRELLTLYTDAWALQYRNDPSLSSGFLSSLNVDSVFKAFGLPYTPVTKKVYTSDEAKDIEGVSAGDSAYIQSSQGVQIPSVNSGLLGTTPYLCNASNDTEVAITALDKKLENGNTTTLGVTTKNAGALPGG